MVKNIKRILLITMIVQIIFIPISNAANAGFWGNIIETGNKFIEEGSNASNVGATEVSQNNLNNTINQIYNALLALGVVISVIVGAALGIKYMVGSVEEQAKIKETLTPYIVGCVVVFGAFGIWKMLILLLGKR